MREKLQGKTLEEKLKIIATEIALLKENRDLLVRKVSFLETKVTDLESRNLPS